MQRLRGAVTCLLAALLLWSCAPRAAWDKSDEASIRGLLGAYQNDWNHHDMKALADLFTDDAEWINVVGMHWRGKADIYKAHDVYHRTLFTKTGIQFTKIEIRAIAPDVAVAVVTEDFDASLLPDGSTRPASQDRFTLVLVKHAGSWKIAHGHNTIINADAQPFDPVNSGWNGEVQQRDSPWVGTWKLNVAKSKFTGTQPPKSETRTEVAQGDGFKVAYEGIAADGNAISYSYTTNLDGKDSPYSGTTPFGADTGAMTRVDANTRTAILKRAGKTLYTVRGIVSKDGKTLTQTSKGMNAEGQPISVTTVWDKQ